MESKLFEALSIIILNYEKNLISKEDALKNIEILRLIYGTTH